MEPEVARRQTALRHRVRATARHIVSDCEHLLEDTARAERRIWRDAVGEALLAGHQLRAIIDRRLPSAAVALSRDELAALSEDLREPQHRVVQSMTFLLALVPTELEDELLLGDARAIRDLALRLGGDDTVVVPVLRDETVRDSVPVPSSRQDRAGAAGQCVPRLLVADDAEGPRFLLVRLLEQLGYAVAVAENGLEAMAIAEGEPIDVILSDIEMPECDGFELLRRLKSNDATRNIPVIMVSGLDDLASVVRCIELGAEDHLAKPFDGVLLRARVRASLERKRLRDREVGYLRRVAQLTVAAEEVERETFDPGSLVNLAGQDDELGRLARVFNRMVSGLRSKEARLEHRLGHLKADIQHSKNGQSLALLSLDAGRLPTGHMLGERYEILEELGSGGMGVVYRAHDRELGEDVAIKAVRKELLALHPGLIERLKTETRLARRITHRNVVRSHDLGEWEGLYFLTMEYVKGITVDSLLETRGRLSVASTLAIGTQLAEALAVAHAQQIIHRDIKPANLLVDDEGVLKVMDFGLARPTQGSDGLTQMGTVVGTPRYMAPEQLLGGDVDERSDLFAAGVVLYECLAGSMPYEASSPTSAVARMLEGPPTPIDQLVPEVTPALAALIDQLLRFEAAERPQSARELAERLREVS